MIIALLIGIVVLIVLILKTKVHPFLGLIIAAVTIGLIGGMDPTKIPGSITSGFGGTLGSIGIIIGFGVMMGQIFDRTGAAERMAMTFIKLFGKMEALNMIKKGSPTHEVSRVSWEDVDGTKDSVMIPLHMAEMDYMNLVQKYEYAFRPYESYSLDWCGETIVGANKIKYNGTLQQLYIRPQCLG